MTPQDRRRVQLREAAMVNELADPYANLSLHVGSRATDYRLTVELHRATTADGHALAELIGLERQSDVPIDRDGAGLYIQRRWTAGDDEAERVLVVHHQSRFAGPTS